MSDVRTPLSARPGTDTSASLARLLDPEPGEHRLMAAPFLPLINGLRGKVRRCSCGWVSVGPAADSEYQGHMLSAYGVS